ncbi:hypothetical protein N8Z40_03430 [Pseudomonadales bacterium]|nr:hypothetical protein [Pseudomonadales bacterium]
MQDKCLNFCTLFNIKYLTRGVAMYESLSKHCDNFHLYIFCFDNATHEFLSEINMANVTLIELGDFENDRLLSIKNKRSLAEYCWTSTPFTILYCITNFDVDFCTYLDADIYFYSNPRVLLGELQGDSILISPHRYTSKYDQSKVSGKYCIQFNTFLNNDDGLAALNWWADACIDWCYATPVNNKFGDQKYLDDWVERFDGVCELAHLGGGVAPWNVQKYSFKSCRSIKGSVNDSNETFELVFYHFHGLDYISNDCVTLGVYTLTESQINQIYLPYIRHLEFLRSKFEISEHRSKKGKPSILKWENLYRILTHPMSVWSFLVNKQTAKKNIVWLSKL